MVSKGISSWSVAVDALRPDVLPFVYDAAEHATLANDLVAAMKSAEVPEGTFSHVAWMFHSTSLCAANKAPMLALLSALQPYLVPKDDDAKLPRVDLLACNAAKGGEGAAVFAELEAESGINLAASTDLTGNVAPGGNWLLETDGVNVKDTYFTDGIAEFTETLWSRDDELDDDSMLDHPMEAIQVRKRHYVVINGRPCRVTERHVSKTGKHGHTKVAIRGIDIFYGDKRDLMVPGHYFVKVPKVIDSTLPCLRVNEIGEAETLDLDTGEAGPTMHIPDSHQHPDGVDLVAMARELIEKDGECVLQIRSSMGMSKVMNVTEALHQ